MSDTEKEKDVSCFSVDGVVAEMVIEVEDNQKSGSEDFKDLSNSPDKSISSNGKADFHSQKDNENQKGNTDKESEPKIFEESKTDEDESSEAEESNKLDMKEAEKAEIERSQAEEIDKSIEEHEKSEESVEELEKSEESVEKLEESEVEDIEKPEAKKKENKENFAEVLEAKCSSKDSEDSKNNEKKNQNFMSKQGRKRMIKRVSTVALSESSVKKEDTSRYPGRKRLANKWYNSEDLITSKTKKSNSVDSKDDAEGVKKIKLEIDAKEEVREIPIKTRRPGRPKRFARNNKDSNINNKEDSKLQSLKKEVDIEDTKTKYTALRKLPFRKNKDAPDVPDLTPNVFLWNGVGEGVGCKLGDIPEITEKIKSARSIRALYKVIFFQWPTNGRDIVEPILEFNGFPFDKSSYEYTKRQSLMKIMPDATVSNICETLDLKKGDKQTMVNNILDFLLRPSAKIDPAQVCSLQPVVVLERLVLDDKFFNETPSEVKSKRGKGSYLTKKTRKENVKSPVVPTRTTRGTTASAVEIVIEPEKSVETSREKLKGNKIKTISPKPVGAKDIKTETPPVKDNKTKMPASSKDSKTKPIPTGKDVKTEVVSDVKETKLLSKEKPKAKVTFAAKNTISKKRKMHWMKRFGAKKKKIIEKSTVSAESKKNEKSSDNESDEYEIEMTIDSGPDMDEDVDSRERDVDKFNSLMNSKEKDKTTPSKQDKNLKSPVSTVTLSDSSETESAEETKLVTASSQSTDIARTPVKLKAQPLKRFPKVCDSIQKANFSALQRLHILLFGSSDKPENLKLNILAFGGFNFLEGSDEWKQKHFLLSLLAQSNLREYLNLLCIPYSGDDQATMIEKLMKFLASPGEELLENKTQKTIETEVVKSELINKSPTAQGKVEAKKRVKKKEKKTVIPPRQRKVLMSEEEARRLEASFAREQRALARDRASTYPTNAKPPPVQLQTTATSKSLQRSLQVGTKPYQLIAMQPIAAKPSTQIKQPIADPQQLNALLQTVYKRRALKAAGAVVSTPNKGEKTKLGEIENVKFLIVTSNLSDLEMLHNLIFMQEASKSRLRKNILDFDGFGFNEDSPKYKERMDFLKRLGYDASKRISFLLGLCPLQTDIPQQDLNELIMYFLMSPCRTKQVVPITEMPPLDERPIAVKPSLPFEKTAYYQNLMKKYAPSTPKTPAEKGSAQTSTPVPARQKARKSFPSSAKASPSPVKKVLLPPYNSAGVGKGAPQKMTLLNSIPAVPAVSLPKTPISNTPPGLTLLNTPSGLALLNTQPISSLLKVPAANTNSNVQILNQGSKTPVADSSVKSPVATIPTISGILQNQQLLIPQISNKIGMPQQNATQSPLVPGAKMLIKTSSGYATAPQEFLVQQQTPDGHQKTFKLIRLPPNHPLASSVKPPGQQTVQSPPVQQQLLLTGAPFMTTNPQTGFILLNSSPGLRLPVPNSPGISILANKTSPSVPKQAKSNTSTEEIVIPDDEVSDEPSANSPNELEISKESESSQPTDEDLFQSIQDVILTSNFEDITLRNVIERVAAQFPDNDLTHRHNYMKECVKKIIVGT